MTNLVNKDTYRHKDTEVWSPVIAFSHLFECIALPFTIIELCPFVVRYQEIGQEEVVMCIPHAVNLHTK